MSNIIKKKMDWIRSIRPGETKVGYFNSRGELDSLAEELQNRGFFIVSGGTDNHSMLVDLRTKYPDLTGKVAEKALVSCTEIG